MSEQPIYPGPIDRAVHDHILEPGPVGQADPRPDTPASLTDDEPCCVCCGEPLHLIAGPCPAAALSAHRYAAVVSGLRRIADELEVHGHLPVDLAVSLMLQPAILTDMPMEATRVATIDTLALALLHHAGEHEDTGLGVWHHTARGQVDGVHVAVFGRMSPPAPTPPVAEQPCAHTWDDGVGCFAILPGIRDRLVGHHCRRAGEHTTHLCRYCDAMDLDLAAGAAGHCGDIYQAYQIPDGAVRERYGRHRLLPIPIDGGCACCPLPAADPIHDPSPTTSITLPTRIQKGQSNVD